MLRTAMVSTRANRNYGPPDGIQPESLIREMNGLMICVEPHALRRGLDLVLLFACIVSAPGLVR
jgi:hypothetical protein